MDNNTNIQSNNKQVVGIKDVAKKAGVSIATVSNVLNGTKAVSAPLRERVLEAVEELDYKANPMGKNLKSGKTNSVAIIIPSMTSVFFPPLIKSLQQHADENDYSLFIFGSSGDLRIERRCVEVSVSHGIEGLFISSCADPGSEIGREYVSYLTSLQNGARKIPVVCLESSLSPQLNTVEADDREGTVAVVEHLISRGRRKIAYISAPQNYQMGVARKKGFYEALRNNDITPDERLIVEGDYTPVSGYLCMQQILSKNLSFDGLACGNDQMAIGAMRALQEAGLTVPGDVAVVGYNDNSVSSLITPSLTTMHVPKTEMGAEAFRLFLRSLNDPSVNPMRVRLTTELMVRSSTDPNAESEWDLIGW